MQYFQNLIKKRHKKIVSLIKDNWFRLFLAMLCMLIVAVTTSATAFLVKPVLDDIFMKKDLLMLKIIPIAIIIVYVIRGIGIYGQGYFMTHVGESIIKHLRDMLYNHMHDLSVSFFYKEKTGVLMSRVTNDVNIVKTMVSTAVTRILRDFFTIVGLAIVTFYRDWQMACFAFIVPPLALYPIAKIGKRVRIVSTGYQEAMGELTAFLHETFAGNKIIKAFGMEEHEVGRFIQKNDSLFKLQMKSIIAKSLSSPLMEFVAGIGVAVIIFYGGSRVIKGVSTPGTFFSFMTAMLLLYSPVKKLSELNNTIQEGLAAADRVFDIIEKEPDIQEKSDAIIMKKIPHNIKFSNVSFKYEDKPVLENINFEVKSGEIIAIVGMSGGGKTSMVNLIPRFYDVCKGAVLIDDIDVRDITISSLRDQIAIVTQEPILFNDTIKNNIAYGDQHAFAQDIEQAAKSAYAYDFIQNFSKKFDTLIGELGGRLSGGEKQRICIARAILKDAPILILDEATSALDAESEKLVQKALNNLMKGRTTFIIAHRLSTIAHAKRILVISDGKIVEHGTHQELISLNKEYSKLYKNQFI